MKNLLFTAFLCLPVYLLFSQATDSSAFYFKKATEAKNARLLAVAGKNFEKAIQFNKNYAEAYIENGKVNLEMRKVDAAMSDFAKAFELQPGNSEVVRELSTPY